MRWPYRISLLVAGLAGLAFGSDYDVTNRGDYLAGFGTATIAAAFIFLTFDIMRED